MPNTNKIMGYARVSSMEQNLDRQILALQEYVPAENILCDKQSGKDLNRPSYQALKSPLGLRSGDTLYVTSLDRLSRSKRDIREELRWFEDHDVRLIVLDLPTTQIEVPDGQDWILKMITNILIEVLSSMAEQERLTIRKRQREGIEAARKKGKHLGRPKAEYPPNFAEIYLKWRNKEITAKQAYQTLHLPRSTFYKLVAKYDK